ncbi:MAG: TolC family protein [Candidatus Hydrogenedentes bacterium]|nr:TolC family protein [Candidatus Hydrogenedentota bacterium]
MKPEKDYTRAGELIQQRTGSNVVYSPTIESDVQQRVAALLDGGLTQEEAIRVALLNNRAFQSIFQEIGVSRADVAQSALLSNPSLSLSARFPEGGGRSNLSVGFAQEIADLWQIPVRKRIAKDQLEQTVFHVVNAAVDLTARVRRAYFDVCSQEEAERVLAGNLDLLKHAQQLARNRFEAGEATILDVNLVASSVLEGQMRLESTRRDRDVARAGFERLLGLSFEQAGVRLTDPLPRVTADCPDEAALVKRALDTRLDVRMAALDLDAAEAEIKHQRRSILSSLVLGIEGERPEARAPRSLKPLPPVPQKPDLSGVTASQSINEAITQLAQVGRGQAQAGRQNAKDLALQELDNWRGRKLEKRQTIDMILGPSLQVTLPIWDQNKAQIAKARFKYAQKQKDYEEMALGVMQDVRESVARLQAAKSLLELSGRDAIPLAEQNIATAQRAYEAGEENILTLLVAQQTLNDHKEAGARFAADYASALADLEKAVGGALEDAAANSPAPVK